jgi:Domain of unknown function (DUF397)
MTTPVKPTAEQLRIREATLDWQRSGQGTGAVEVAFAWADGQQWALMRISGDLDARVLVFSRFEWDCFLDGAKMGEFDDAECVPGSSDGALGESRP